MTILEAVILGVVQGITEFFPVSSSGHLVISQALFGLSEPLIAFDIFLHLGTLIAILVFFWKDILNLFLGEKRLLYYLILASIPTFIIGISFKGLVERFFVSPGVVGYMLLVTGSWLIIASLYDEKAGRNGAFRKVGVLNSIIIGVAQGIALMPGISRSGATIATGILTGLEREEAFKFSFLLAIPAILGATFIKAHKIGQGVLGKDFFYFIAGGITAMMVGIFALKVLLKLVRGKKLYAFGIYCIVIGAIVIVRW